MVNFQSKAIFISAAIGLLTMPLDALRYALPRKETANLECLWL